MDNRLHIWFATVLSIHIDVVSTSAELIGLITFYSSSFHYSSLLASNYFSSFLLFILVTSRCNENIRDDITIGHRLSFQISVQFSF